KYGMQNTFEQCATMSLSPTWSKYPTTGSPSTPIASDVPIPSPAGSSVEIDAEEHSTFEQWAILTGPVYARISYATSPSPSAPVAIEVHWPTGPAPSIVAVVADEHATFEQWATFRLPL